jgi:hypothetical protein
VKAEFGIRITVKGVHTARKLFEGIPMTITTFLVALVVFLVGLLVSAARELEARDQALMSWQGRSKGAMADLDGSSREVYRLRERCQELARELGDKGIALYNLEYILRDEEHWLFMGRHSNVGEEEARYKMYADHKQEVQAWEKSRARGEVVTIGGNLRRRVVEDNAEEEEEDPYW